MHLNRTEDYHRSGLLTLGWELTVCNSLADEKSPCRRALKYPVSFGEALFRLLETHLPMHTIKKVMEVGGGYGNLMADFMRLNPDIKPTMIDISPALLDRQRESLRGNEVVYMLSDFFDVSEKTLSFFDLAIFNENLGDFPTVCDVPSGAINNLMGEGADILAEIRRDFKKYKFPIPDRNFFHYNIGAVRALEKLCAAHIPFIYVSEHSCEAHLPVDIAEFLDVPADDNPRAIRLCGHVEYTVRFSHLESVAAYHGYAVQRGCFADFIPVEWSDEIRFIVRSKSIKEEHEIVRHFIEDLYTYEYLVLVKK